MELTIIAAVSENNVIGIDGKVPWHIKEDTARFKRLTLDHPVMMGRATYESIPLRFRPLAQRKNIILSSVLEPAKGIYVARSIGEAVRFAEDKDSYVIGGESIYRQFMHLATRMELTRVHRDFQGDAFFPEFNPKDWNLDGEIKEVSEPGEGSINYSFITYSRR